MVVISTPAIGASAAFGLALAGYESAYSSTDGLLADLLAASDNLKVSRSIAVNLTWTFNRLSSALSKRERVDGNGSQVTREHIIEIELVAEMENFLIHNRATVPDFSAGS